jgi:hypothetical protein
MTPREAELVFGTGATPRQVQEYARMSIEQFLDLVVTDSLRSPP